MENVEFKAELKDLDLARAICRAIGAQEVATLVQTDTYFRLPEGRLKKRETEGQPTEWIVYERADEPGVRLSRFHIYDEAEATERFGEREPAVWVVVKKVREVWMLGRVRVHLDRVEGLGNFLELEALICARQRKDAAEAAVAELKADFMPALGETIAVSYSDLVAAAA
jgi:adenylate cyclase class 2